jgi:thiol-disulfide isomerase/thioredoxin
MRFKNFGIITIVVLALFCTKLFSQNGNTANREKTKLSIGDPAPKLKYSKWIQGKPVTEIKEDKIYIIEFWATWCSPCIQAMPHISELADKYSKTHVFIGCNVMENVGNKPYESSISKVTHFVEKQKELKRMTYNVMMDNNALDMNKSWLDAAGISGIPSSFVIQKGKIAWIGHPKDLDTILASIEDGSYDMEKTQAEYNKNQPVESEAEKKWKHSKALIAEAEAEKNYSKAIQAIDDAIVNQPDLKFTYMTDKFRILLDNYSEDQAIAYGNEIVKGDVGVQSISRYLLQRDNLSVKMNKYAVEFARHIKKEIPGACHLIASLEARAGYYTQAAVSEQLAIDQATELVKANPGYKEFFNDDLMAEYKKNVEEYKRKAIK